MFNKVQRFSIRKLTVGAASVLIGLAFVGTMQSQKAQAAEINSSEKAAAPSANDANANEAAASAAKADTQAAKLAAKAATTPANNAASNENKTATRTLTFVTPNGISFQNGSHQQDIVQTMHFDENGKAIGSDTFDSVRTPDVENDDPDGYAWFNGDSRYDSNIPSWKNTEGLALNNDSEHNHLTFYLRPVSPEVRQTASRIITIHAPEGMFYDHHKSEYVIEQKLSYDKLGTPVYRSEYYNTFPEEGIGKIDGYDIYINGKLSTTGIVPAYNNDRWGLNINGLANVDVTYKRHVAAHTINIKYVDVTTGKVLQNKSVNNDRVNLNSVLRPLVGYKIMNMDQLYKDFAVKNTNNVSDIEISKDIDAEVQVAPFSPLHVKYIDEDSGKVLYEFHSTGSHSSQAYIEDKAYKTQGRHIAGSKYMVKAINIPGYQLDGADEVIGDWDQVQKAGDENPIVVVFKYKLVDGLKAPQIAA